MKEEGQNPYVSPDYFVLVTVVRKYGPFSLDSRKVFLQGTL